MKAIDFEDSNDVLRCGKNKNCNDLYIHRAKNFIVSCWQPSLEELKEIQRTGKIYLLCMGGTHPPINITGHRHELLLPE